MNPVLVIGAGPAGLAVAACLSRLGVNFRLVDREGLAGGSYRRLYPRIQLASPARWTSLPHFPLAARGEYVTVAEYADYLQSYAEHFALSPERTEVRELTRTADGSYEARFSGAQNGHSERFQAVVAASGMDGLCWPDFPRPAAGPCWLHSRAWQGPEPFAGQRLLVIGRGVSAVEIAEEAVAHGVSTTVSCRGKVGFGPRRIFGRDVHDYAFLLSWLPRWLARGYCRRSPTFTGYDQGFRRYLKEGRLRQLPLLTRFEDRVAIFPDGVREEFDAVVCATGYRFALDYLPPDTARSPLGGHPLGNHGESVSHPGLYLMGVHCARGVSSQFLRGMALDAPAVAARIRRRLEGSL